MKALLLIILFITVVPILIGYLAGLSGKSKNDLVQLATMAGILILFTLYLLFISDKKPEKKQAEKKSPPASEKSASECDVNITCVNSNGSYHPVYVQEERREQQPKNEEQFCDPTYPPY